MTIEFEQRDLLDRTLQTPRRFTGEDIVLDEREARVGPLSFAPARSAHVESDNAISFADFSKGRMPYMNTGLSGELRREQINGANLRTRRDRFGRYWALRWRPTTGRDMDEELDRFGRFLRNTASNIVHEITTQVLEARRR